MTILQETFLENGLTVRYYDQTQRYFGDYFRVRLEVVCEVSLLREDCLGVLSRDEAQALLGERIRHRRTIEQMAVPSEKVEQTLADLMEKFNRHSLPYIASSSFPPRIVLAEIDKLTRKMHRMYAP